MAPVSGKAPVAEALALATQRSYRSVVALGAAIHAARVEASPALTRSVQAAENLYDAIDAEFGLLTSAEAGARMGSRSSARRNAATAARRAGRLLALRRGRYDLFPGFQFDASGPRPVIAHLIQVARDHDWSETGLVEWLCSPTTYLSGKRPVDVLVEPERVLDAARNAFGVRW